MRPVSVAASGAHLHTGTQVTKRPLPQDAVQEVGEEEDEEEEDEDEEADGAQRNAPQPKAAAAQAGDARETQILNLDYGVQFDPIFFPSQVLNLSDEPATRCARLFSGRSCPSKLSHRSD